MRANYQVNATTQFRVLSDDQIEEIFYSALDVLERVGTRVYGEEGLALLRDAGCPSGDDGLVHIPSWLVKDALNTTPERIVIAGRDRSRRIYLEKDKIHFGTGSDCPSLIDPYTDKVRKYTYEDVYNAARISDALPHIDFHMSLGLTSGVLPQTYDRPQFLAMLQGTSKPFIITTVDKEGLADQYRMACEVLGGPEEFAKMPLFIVYIEPSSPLSNSIEAVEKILYAAEKGIPAIFTPCIMCGATGPVTLAGAMTLKPGSACRPWRCGRGTICMRTWIRIWGWTIWRAPPASIASGCRGRSRRPSGWRRMPIWSSCAWPRPSSWAGSRACSTASRPSPREWGGFPRIPFRPATGAGGDEPRFCRPEPHGPLVPPRLRADTGALPQTLLESSRPLSRQARAFGHPPPTEPKTMLHLAATPGAHATHIAEQPP